MDKKDCTIRRSLKKCRNLKNRIHLTFTLSMILHTLSTLILRPIYHFYEKNLINKIKRGRVPPHVGIIMDGNRRFAEEVGMVTRKGHEMGATKVEKVIDWCVELEIRGLTVYAFSTENFKRPKEEVDRLMCLFERKFHEFAHAKKIHQNKIRIKVIGNLELTPESVRKAIEIAESSTQQYSNLHFNVCIAYGGRSEITEALRRIAKKVKEGDLSPKDITEKTVRNHLHGIDSDPDLIIRTGGEVRLSNFLLFQAAYSELFFCDVYFPAFRKIDFLRIIRVFQERERRFGTEKSVGPLS